MNQNARKLMKEEIRIKLMNECIKEMIKNTMVLDVLGSSNPSLALRVMRNWISVLKDQKKGGGK